MQIRNAILFLLMLFLTADCVDPVAVQSIQFADQLVVEGYLSSEFKNHQVRISHTTELNNKTFAAEQGATVSISTGSTFFPLTEVSPGVYQTSIMAGIIGAIYQLHITTKGGKSYQSQPVTLKYNPTITNIYGAFPAPDPTLPEGIQIMLDTQDPSGQTRYFRWEYEDTYEIQTPFNSMFVWLGDNNVNIRERPVNRCWKSDTLRNILIQSTAGLSDNKVTAFPLKFIPSESDMLFIKYSILVRQYPLSEDMYRYWKLLRDINQTQGSLFDVQPGSVRGNMESATDPSELVLGYFDAGVVQSQRVFFTPSQFKEAGYVPLDPYSICGSIKPAQVPFNEIGSYMKIYGPYQDISGVTGSGYELLPKTCCNCTQKATNVMPPYWQ